MLQPAKPVRRVLSPKGQPPLLPRDGFRIGRVTHVLDDAIFDQHHRRHRDKRLGHRVNAEIESGFMGVFAPLSWKPMASE
jgi:hypothetical protein